MCAPEQRGEKKTDPHGKSPHEPGAKLDAGKTRTGLMLLGFGKALEEVARVTTYGAQKYTPNGWYEVDNGIMRYTDAMSRHLLAEVREENDTESGLRHAAHLAWNALARLELMLREDRREKS
jgi:hypothetical protein